MGVKYTKEQADRLNIVENKVKLRPTKEDIKIRLDLERIVEGVKKGSPPPSPPKKSKYRSKKVRVGDMIFDSHKEYRYFLRLEQDKARYLHMERQKTFNLSVNGHKICRYIADFYYFDTEKNGWIVADVKSRFTAKLPVYRLKKKLMLAILGIEIIEITEV